MNKIFIILIIILFLNNKKVKEKFSSTTPLEYIKKYGDKKMMEILKDMKKNNIELTKDNLIKETHKHCANMRFTKSISTSYMPIKNKDNTKEKKFNISVCCTSDYCNILNNDFYYKKNNNITYLFKRSNNKLVQVITSIYYTDSMFPLISLKKVKEICKN